MKFILFYTNTDNCTFWNEQYLILESSSEEMAYSFIYDIAKKRIESMDYFPSEEEELNNIFVNIKDKEIPLSSLSHINKNPFTHVSKPVIVIDFNLISLEDFIEKEKIVIDF